MAGGIEEFLPDVIGGGSGVEALLAPALRGALGKMTDDAAVSIAETMQGIATRVLAASVAVAGARSQD